MSPARRRGRAVGVLTAAALLVGGLTSAHPSAAVDSDSLRTQEGSTATMPGRGSMDESQLPLSGPEAPVGEDRSGSTKDGGATPPAPGDQGWTQVLDLLQGTQMVALSWDGTTSGPDGPASGRASLRSRTGGGPWTEWLDLAPDPSDQGGEGVGRVGSDLIWLGSEGADQVEVRVDAGPLVDLQLLRLRYHEGQPVPVEEAPGSEARSGTTKAAQPSIRPRSSWASRGWASGNSGCGSGPSISSRLDHAVIHHTASTNSYTQAQVPGLLDGIRAYHQSSLGWCDTAYNFVVDRFGGIWQGRDGDISKPVLGGHAKGFNTNSVGVALLGQFEPGASPASAAPTSAMIDSTARFLAWKLGLHGLDPNGTVTATSAGSSRYSAGTRVTVPVINPHQVTSYTACPGANVLSQMGALRLKVTAYMGGGGGGGGGTFSPFSSAENLVYRQYVDFLRHPGTYEGRRWWYDRLNSGTTNRNALIVSLLESADLQDRSASSVRLYLAYFGRIPDHPGLRHWWGEMDRGAGIRSVSAAFARSPEFVDRYGALSDGGFVDLVYRNVLGRAPDASGYSYWTNRLRTKSENRGGLMAQFSESPEHRAHRRDVVEVVVTFEAMLQRGVSTTDMLQWVARTRLDRTALMAFIFTSSEYAPRAS